MTSAACSKWERKRKASLEMESPLQLLCRYTAGALGTKGCKKKCVGGNDLARKQKEACPFLPKSAPFGLSVLSL